jgi:hypothetical protein
MGRSISGPYVAYHLLNKLNALNEKDNSKRLKHGHDHQRFYQ